MSGEFSDKAIGALQEEITALRIEVNLANNRAHVAAHTITILHNQLAESEARIRQLEVNEAPLRNIIKNLKVEIAVAQEEGFNAARDVIMVSGNEYLYEHVDPGMYMVIFDEVCKTRFAHEEFEDWLASKGKEDGISKG